MCWFYSLKHLFPWHVWSACLTVWVSVRLLPACPAGKLQQLLASDVLWSDPSNLPGHVDNHLRGVGTRFGPDVTEVRPAFADGILLMLDIRNRDALLRRLQRETLERANCMAGRSYTVAAYHPATLALSTDNAFDLA